jgi:phosphoglycerate kinase
MEIQSITEASDLSSKRVFVRVDFNVPIIGGRIVDDFRIKAALPTIQFLIGKKAKVILATHFVGKEGNSLTPVSDRLKNFIPHTFVPSPDLVVIGEHIDRMKDGDVALLPNLRLWRGEEMGDERFAKDFSRLVDLYVNEAFSASHRLHASITLMPKFLPAYAGIRFLEEIKNLSQAFNPEEPFLFIIGGAKFETKEPLISKFLNTATNIFIGGALANDFFKEKGFGVGLSLVSQLEHPISKEILENDKIILPSDVTVRSEDGSLVVKKPDTVLLGEKIVDAGPQTVLRLKELSERAKLILWNGPLGIYEEGIVKETEELAIVVAESEAVSIVGGGDTTAAIKRLELQNAFDFLSTGGGAMLEFLAKETLPGIEALKNKNA